MQFITPKRNYFSQFWCFESMSRISLIISALLLTVFSSAVSQVLQPATWTVGTNLNEVNAGETFEVIFDVTIDPDWYLYSSDFDPDCGPMVTTFTFNEHSMYRAQASLNTIVSGFRRHTYRCDNIYPTLKYCGNL